MLFSWKGVARRCILGDKQPRIYPEFTDRLRGGAARGKYYTEHLFLFFFSFFNADLTTRGHEEKLSIICVIIYGLP